MNRTIIYASRHAKDALRPGIRLPSCLSCVVTRNHSQRGQYHLLRRLPVEAPSSASTSIRLLSTKRTKKSKGPKLLSPKKERFKQYPLLEGEQQPAFSRTFNKIQIEHGEQQEQRYKERITIEQQRISFIQDKPQRPKSKSDSSAEKRFSSTRSPRTQPWPAQKGVYSPDSPAPKKKTKKPAVGRPKTQRQKDKAIFINASSLLKNYSPDFSVEWPEGIPLPPKIPHWRDTSRVAVQYPYFVRRTKSKNLPVYNVGKHGGSLQITQIHHVEGDPRGLLLELGKELDVSLNHISYNPMTKRIIIRTGKMRDEVKAVLKKLGF